MDKMISGMFGGTLPNSAFCLYDPSGKKRLCRPSRSPHSLTNSRVGENPKAVAQAMKMISAKYTAQRGGEPPLLQDFNSLEEAINISAGDQRLLVLLHSENQQMRDRLRKVISAPQMIGRFHVDVIQNDESQKWKHLLGQAAIRPGILIVRPGQFGVKGELMEVVSEGSSFDELRSSLVKANKIYGKITKRRGRRGHIAAGTRKGISYDIEKPDNARSVMLRDGGSKRKIME